MVDIILIAVLICLSIISGVFIVKRKGKCASCGKDCPCRSSKGN